MNLPAQQACVGVLLMDESEVNQIIVDSMEPDIGNKFEKLDKEFMILKGSIKKLILDIREQMNNTDNPFSNIQMLQMPPPAPVIKEDPVELELPKKDEKPADSNDAAKAEAAKQAEVQAAKEKAAEVQAAREKIMAQEKKQSTGNTCPLAAKAEATHSQCPISASSNTIEQSCPFARANSARYGGCQANQPTYHPNYHTQYHQPAQSSPCGNPGWEAANGGGAPYGSYPVRSGEMHVCPGCGMPIDPHLSTYPGYRPLPYQPQRRESRRGLSDYDMPREASMRPAYVPRPYFYDHPEYGPAQYGYPYRQAPGNDDGYDLLSDVQERSRRAPARARGEYYYQDSDDYYYDYERTPSAYRQRADDEYGDEPGYDRPAPKKRRVARAPEASRDYYEPETEERTEPARYRSAPRRRRSPYPPAPGYETEDDFEITEPIPEIDSLPDQPEPEQDLIRIRKRPRISRVLHEPVAPDMIIEQPNPKPRRSRSAKLRG